MYSSLLKPLFGLGQKSTLKPHPSKGVRKLTANLHYSVYMELLFWAASNATQFQLGAMALIIDVVNIPFEASIDQFRYPTTGRRAKP